MNQRLTDAYKDLEQQNEADFLENKLNLATMWGKEIFGIFFAIDPAQNVKDIIATYQKSLDQLEPGNLLLPPKEAQHVSVNQIIFWNGKYMLGGKETWKRIQDEFLERFYELNQAFNTFEITFSKLIPTRNAIIWAAYDQADELQHLRTTIRKKLPFPKETENFNSIIHTTVARFKNNLKDPRRVMDYLKQQNDHVAMRVERLTLREALILPSLKTEDIAKISLK